ncbi:helix-turn-helix domain-containing protein [Streptococcus iniae]|uniref:PucR family transcriptional regulator n=1 Tax=Streptococcus iniae TaxID=1346 RepID=A0A3L8GQN9_STRIN|nr:helix-turn-helix domain-containing protein [Streptococcus iniae]AGM98092.1 leucine-rich protein Lrp [Streptococcus iniae SF1]AHY15160.1 PucR family transcriptional regulator [Streptococcus iniae]AHY17031.1 PucR family transcriptional regulator [Streptococcus iniae]AJG25349.1 PucR family transcriptional regulator [Streptococcus iniae]APD31221.1 PucR family transcriptional regulator [Streptococcus iniae]
MELKELFPGVTCGAFPLSDDAFVSIEEDGRFFHFPKDSLSERELSLLSLKTGQKLKNRPHLTAWEGYLLKGTGKLPDLLEFYQFLYLNHHQSLSEELIDLLVTLLGGVQAVVRISQSRTAFLLNPKEEGDAYQILKDVLPTVENDFGLALSAFLGNPWTLGTNNQLKAFFEEENTLFSAYLSRKGDKKLTYFSELMVWSLLVQISVEAIQDHFNQIFLQNKDVSDIVTALWQCQGNMVQTAQRLFIHRNSLQYKLDKLLAQSGLNLKNLDDLAFVHLFLLT